MYWRAASCLRCADYAAERERDSFLFNGKLHTIPFRRIRPRPCRAPPSACSRGQPSCTTRVARRRTPPSAGQGRACAWTPQDYPYEGALEATKCHPRGPNHHQRPHIERGVTEHAKCDCKTEIVADDYCRELLSPSLRKNKKTSVSALDAETGGPIKRDCSWLECAEMPDGKHEQSRQASKEGHVSPRQSVSIYTNANLTAPKPCSCSRD